MTHARMPKDFHVLPIPTPFPVGPVNVFLWKGEPLTLIDTGPNTQESLEALRTLLAQHGVTMADLERIILTHHHVDHIGLLRRIQEEANAVTYAHPDVPSDHYPHTGEPADWESFLAASFHEFGVPETHIGTMLSFLGEFRKLSEPYHIDATFEDAAVIEPFTAYYVPGHSVTDTLLAHHEDRYTIVGDHILENTNPNPLLHRPKHPSAPRLKSLVAYQRSLRRSRELDLGLCFPGHGEPFNDHRRVIDKILSKHHRREAIVRKCLTSEGMTPFQVASSLYPNQPKETLYLTLSVAVGQLEVLEEKHLAHSEIRDGILYFMSAEHAVSTMDIPS